MILLKVSEDHINPFTYIYLTEYTKKNIFFKYFSKNLFIFGVGWICTFQI